VDGAIDYFMGLQTWGTPDMCHETIIINVERIGAEAYIGIFSYGGRPWKEAERNLKYFAKNVMPALQARSISGKTDWAA